MNADDIEVTFVENWGLKDHQSSQLSLWPTDEGYASALLVRSDLDPRLLPSIQEWAAVALNQVFATGDPIANGWNHSASERGGWYMTAAAYDLPEL